MERVVEVETVPSIILAKKIRKRMTIREKKAVAVVTIPVVRAKVKTMAAAETRLKILPTVDVTELVGGELGKRDSGRVSHSTGSRRCKKQSRTLLGPL